MKPICRSVWVRCLVMLMFAGLVSACIPASIFVATPTNLSFLPNKIRDLPVAMVVTNDLKDAEWLDKSPVGGETPNYKLGDALVSNSANVLKKLFKEVYVTDRDASSAASTPASSLDKIAPSMCL